MSLNRSVLNINYTLFIKTKGKNIQTLNENSNVAKQRHGCVTAWLITMIVLNSLGALLYLLASEWVAKNLPHNVSTSTILLLGVIEIGNVVFSVLLFQWKKIGFYGFVMTSIVALIINLSIGTGAAQSVFGILGIALLYGVLQIKKDNVTAWENLE